MGSPEKIVGVAAVIYIPQMPEKGCVTLEELRTKRSTNKSAHQRTIPMESSLPGESEVQTLIRLAKEEVHINNFSIDETIRRRRRIAVCELNVGIFVPIYGLPLPASADVIIGSESKEVTNLEWTLFDKIIQEPKDSLHFRPGNFEAVSSHLSSLQDPEYYTPRRYSHSDLKHRIPTRLFDLVESGFTVSRALSQLGIDPKFWPGSLSLGHLQSPLVPALQIA